MSKLLSRIVWLYGSFWVGIFSIFLQPIPSLAKSSNHAPGDIVTHRGVPHFSGVSVQTTDYDMKTARQPLLVFEQANPTQIVYGFVNAVSTQDAMWRLAIRCVVKSRRQTFGPITAKLKVQSYDPYRSNYDDLASFNVIITDRIPANEFRTFIFSPTVNIADLNSNQEFLVLWNRHRRTTDVGSFRWTFDPDPVTSTTSRASAQTSIPRISKSSSIWRAYKRRPLEQGDRQAIRLVQDAVFTKINPYATVGESVECFFSTPKWAAGTGKDGQLYVTVWGQMQYKGNLALGAIQFAVNKKSGTIQAGAMEINGVGQMAIVRGVLLKKILQCK